MRITIPGLRLTNTANGSQGRTKKGGRVRSVKRKETRTKAADGVRIGLAANRGNVPALPVIVTIVRVAPNKLDGDGLANACKQVRDAVALALNPKLDKNGTVYGDDRDDGPITWRYWQRKGKPREYACELLIEPRETGAVESVLRDRFHVFADGESACIDTAWNIDGRPRHVARFKPQQLRAFVVQCDEVLQKLMEAEHER